MIFTKFTIYHLRLQFKEPFTTNFLKLKYKDTVFIKGETEKKLIGYGEAPALQYPLYDYEYTGATIDTLKRFILPLLIGKKINTVADLDQVLEVVKGYKKAKTALEMAYWHIKSQQEKAPLWKLWGGSQKRVTVAISLGFEKDLIKLNEKIETALRRGYRLIKVNIQPRCDLEIVKAIRKKFGDISLILEANSAYTLNHLNDLKRLDRYTNIVLEQPLNPDDLFAHAKLQRMLETPIMLDESITSLEIAQEAITLGACDMLNIIPCQVGGYEKAIAIAKLCEKHHLPVRCGGIMESGWGKLFSLNLATLSSFSLAGDISSTDRYFKTDLISPALTMSQDGFIDAPQQQTDYHINLEAMKKLTITKIEVKG